MDILPCEENNKWIWMYNNERPHSSLNNMPPRAFLLKYGKLHLPKDHTHEFATFQQDRDDDDQYQEYSLLLNEAK